MRDHKPDLLSSFRRGSSNSYSVQQASEGGGGSKRWRRRKRRPEDEEVEDEEAVRLKRASWSSFPLLRISSFSSSSPGLSEGRGVTVRRKSQSSEDLQLQQLQLKERCKAKQQDSNKKQRHPVPTPKIGCGFFSVLSSSAHHSSSSSSSSFSQSSSTFRSTEMSGQSSITSVLEGWEEEEKREGKWKIEEWRRKGVPSHRAHQIYNISDINQPRQTSSMGDFSNGPHGEFSQACQLYCSSNDFNQAHQICETRNFNLRMNSRTINDLLHSAPIQHGSSGNSAEGGGAVGRERKKGISYCGQHNPVRLMTLLSRTTSEYIPPSRDVHSTEDEMEGSTSAPMLLEEEGHSITSLEEEGNSITSPQIIYAHRKTPDAKRRSRKEIVRELETVRRTGSLPINFLTRREEEGRKEGEGRKEEEKENQVPKKRRDEKPKRNIRLMQGYRFFGKPKGVARRDTETERKMEGEKQVEGRMEEEKQVEGRREGERQVEVRREGKWEGGEATWEVEEEGIMEEKRITSRRRRRLGEKVEEEWRWEVEEGEMEIKEIGGGREIEEGGAGGRREISRTDDTLPPADSTKPNPPPHLTYPQHTHTTTTPSHTPSQPSFTLNSFILNHVRGSTVKNGEVMLDSDEHVKTSGDCAVKTPTISAKDNENLETNVENSVKLGENPVKNDLATNTNKDEVKTITRSVKNDESAVKNELSVKPGGTSAKSDENPVKIGGNAENNQRLPAKSLHSATNADVSRGRAVAGEILARNTNTAVANERQANEYALKNERTHEPDLSTERLSELTLNNERIGETGVNNEWISNLALINEHALNIERQNDNAGLSTEQQNEVVSSAERQNEFDLNNERENEFAVNNRFAVNSSDSSPIDSSLTSPDFINFALTYNQAFDIIEEEEEEEEGEMTSSPVDSTCFERDMEHRLEDLAGKEEEEEEEEEGGLGGERKTTREDMEEEGGKNRGASPDNQHPRKKTELKLNLVTPQHRAIQHVQRTRLLRHISEEGDGKAGSGGEGEGEVELRSTPSTPRSPAIDLDELFRQQERELEEGSDDMSRVRDLATRLHLRTRRPSYLDWTAQIRERGRKVGEALAVHAPVVVETEDQQGKDYQGTPRTEQDKGSHNRKPCTEEDKEHEQRKRNLQTAVEWVKKELMAMRAQDQQLARQLMRLRVEVQRVRLVRSCHNHQALVQEVVNEAEEAKLAPDLCDMPADSRETFSPVLRDIGVTRMNITSRRFSLR